jgi:uncharacterized damage-inducible protein DinB
MKRAAVALMCLLVLPFAFAQDQKPEQRPPTLRSILLDQLKTTHTEKDWFVPANVAVEGLTAEQASWTDGHGNHSIGQLTYHLAFWNAQTLAKFKGETPAKFGGNNDETFNDFDAKKWKDTVAQLDRVMAELEKFVETADEKTIEKNAPTIARVGTHNAYHIGQIIYIRRLQGSWNPEKGVK